MTHTKSHQVKDERKKKKRVNVIFSLIINLVV